MDEYVDAALRMLERCTNAPRRALIGNWVHDLPDEAYPGPNLDWLHEIVRFFDHWLKGIDNGVDGRAGADLLPATTTPPPEPFPATWPGALAERAAVAAGRMRASRRSSSPAATAARRRARRRRRRRPAVDVERLPHRATIGTRTALSWGAGGPPNGLARDLRLDDALGPDLHARAARRRPRRPRRPGSSSIESPMPVATAVVRLQDVAPDGTPFQVSAGVLNLTHRSSHAEPDAARARRVTRSACGCARPAIGSGPGIGSGCPSRRRCGRSSGRRHSPPTYRAPSRRRPAGPPRPARAAGRRAGDAGSGVQDDAARSARGRRRTVASHRSGRSSRT